MDLLRYNLGEGVEAFTTRRDSVLPYPVIQRYSGMNARRNLHGPVIQPHQTHSANVAVIDRPDYSREELEGVDALVTNLKNVAIGVRTADCIPVLLYDPVSRCVGAAHSGWRGTINKIAAQTVLAMIKNYGAKPSDMRAVIGPGICIDNFQARMWRSFSRRPVSLWIKSGRSAVRVLRAVSRAAIISTFSKSAALRFWNAEWQSPTSRSAASVPTMTPISSPPVVKDPTAAAISMQ